MKRTTSYHEHLIENLKTHEIFREAYLNEALNEADGRIALHMFRNVAEALGGITRLAKKTGLNRQNLYKALSGKKDPAFSTVEGIVHGFGFRIKVEPYGKSDKAERALVVREKRGVYKAK